MKSRDTDLLMLPGLGGSGPEHWQSRWQAKLPTARRVEQADWDHPVLATWLARTAEAVAGSTRPIVLVAHSLGVVTAVHLLASIDPARVAGVFLVAPPADAAMRALPAIDPAFTPTPLVPLPCPAVVVASHDDPYASFDETTALATAWGGALLDAGHAGHINTDSGHGPWPEGLMAFAGFLSKL